jgi:hypothetical protein
MKKAVELSGHDWGQVLDGLCCRLELYEQTVQYFKTGEAEGEIAEVRGVDEAENMAEIYRDLISKIQTELRS